MERKSSVAVISMNHTMLVFAADLPGLSSFLEAIGHRTLPNSLGDVQIFAFQLQLYNIH